VSPRKYYAGGHKATRLVGNISAGATSFNVEDAAGLPGSVPFVLTLARGTSAEEKVLVTARTGTSMTAVTRAYDGTTAASHNAVTVEHTIDAESLTEAATHVYDTNHDFTAAIATHVAAGDPHPTYLTQAEADALYVTLATGPRGKLGFASVTANQTLTGYPDLTNLSTTVTVAGSRRVRITGYGLIRSSTANDYVAIEIFEGSTSFGYAEVSTGSVANSPVVCHATAVISPSAGSHTYKLKGGVISGAGTGTLVAAATLPAYILVEDIGAV